MDVAKPRRRRSTRYWVLAGLVLAAAGVTLGLRWLRAGAPTIDRSMVVISEVVEGDMVREVSGPGVLEPVDVRFITSDNPGRVERVLVEAGAEVEADAILVELSNPEVERRALEVGRELAQARAKLAELTAGLDNQRLAQESQLASIAGDLAEARRQATASRGLHARGAVSTIERDNAVGRVTTLESRLEFERGRLAAMRRSRAAQLAAQREQIASLVDLVEFSRRQVDGLAIRAGAVGVVADLRVEPGQSVAAGAILGRVVDPARLKAVLRIPETLARDVAVGLPATIDTRTHEIHGRVIRVDPAASGGTVGVDVALDGELPDSARIDLNIDGTIEIEKLTRVVYAGRPAFAEPESTASIYRLDPGGDSARRVSVELGKASVKTVEIRSGLEPGDRIILSDLGDAGDAPLVRIE